MAEPSMFEERSDRETVVRLTAAIERAYTRTGILVWRSLLQGFMSVLGAALASILLFLLGIYLFSAFGGPTLFQNFIASISDSVVHTQEQSLLKALPLK